jgi:hypothetical protein
MVAGMEDFPDLEVNRYLAQLLSPEEARGLACSKPGCRSLVSKALCRNGAREIQQQQDCPIEETEELLCDEHFEQRRAEINSKAAWRG